MKNKFTFSSGQVNIRQWSWSSNGNFHVWVSFYFSIPLQTQTCIHIAKSTILCKCTHIVNIAWSMQPKPGADNLIVLFPLPIFSRMMIPPFFLSFPILSPKNKFIEITKKYICKVLLHQGIHYTWQWYRKWFFSCWSYQGCPCDGGCKSMKNKKTNKQTNFFSPFLFSLIVVLCSVHHALYKCTHSS